MQAFLFHSPQWVKLPEARGKHSFRERPEPVRTPQILPAQVPFEVSALAPPCLGDALSVDGALSFASFPA